MRHEPIDPKLFIENRRRLGELLLDNSLAVLNANDVLPTNADGALALIPNSDLFYLSGIEQEQSILLLYPQADDERCREMLFLREAHPDLERWEGHKLSLDEARQISGIKEVHWLSHFPRVFHRLMCECEHVYLNSNEHKRAIIEVETRDARFVRDTMRKYPLHDYQRLARVMHKLRVVKSPEEIELLHEAVRITGDGFHRVLERLAPGVNECEIEAEFAYEFIRNRARFAYLPIIASGRNACVLHYIANDQPCRKGDLLLLDVAASYANYNADLTRTIPVSGKFSRRQKQVYNEVLRALQAASDNLAPGKLWKDWQHETEQILEEACVNLGLITMNDIKRQNPDQPAFKKYFMHGAGHPLGLDVHDVGFMTERMEAGWVMTVEPALYIEKENIGVRLENDVVITEGGNLNLMTEIPVKIEEIEALMRG
jgi:Xaa-Pro aminopeptidase